MGRSVRLWGVRMPGSVFDFFVEVRGAGRGRLADGQSTGVCQLSTAAMYRPAPRVHRNLQLLGILWCAFGALRLLGGLLAMFFVKMMWFGRFGDNWQFSHLRRPFGPQWMAALMPVIMMAAVLASAWRCWWALRY